MADKPSLPGSFLSVSSASQKRDRAPASGSRPGASLAVPTGVKTRSLNTPKSESKPVIHPGYSMFDWNKFCSSSHDLAGTGGRILKVTEEELARHNTEDDVWTALRGKVYNVTPFLKYHPGGKSNMMRGAGVDCTEVFDKLHAWVNEEAILKHCLVGVLIPSSYSQGSVRQKNQLTAPQIPKDSKPEEDISIQVPSVGIPLTTVAQLFGSDID